MVLALRRDLGGSNFQIIENIVENGTTQTVGNRSGPYMMHDTVQLVEMVEEEEMVEIRRQCISSMIEIIQNSSKSEKKENLRKIKKELQFKATDSASRVVQGLREILVGLDMDHGQQNKPGRAVLTQTKLLKTLGNQIKFAPPRKSRPASQIVI